MPELYNTLWTPWRMAYIRSLAPEGTGDACFLCKYWAARGEDRANHVLWRGPTCFAALNRFPYNNGHVLVAPARHTPGLQDLTEAELAELIRLLRDTQVLMSQALRPHGFNVGINMGRCAGAGLPDHIHAHLVPRWDGDTNFMAVVGDARVVPQDLDQLYDELASAAARVSLPPLTGSR